MPSASCIDCFPQCTAVRSTQTVDLWTRREHGLRRWRACESAVSMAAETEAPDGRVCPARRPQDTEQPAVETALMTHQFISSRYHVKPTSARPKLMNQNLNACMQMDTNTQQIKTQSEAESVYNNRQVLGYYELFWTLLLFLRTKDAFMCRLLNDYGLCEFSWCILLISLF